MKFTERAFVFPCAGENLLGIVASPSGEAARKGVLIIVGGPQYRAGSHRQFVLLSRTLAEAGYPAMRFDYRGMGDSTGEIRNFEHINADIAAAINAFMASCPQLQQIVLWGLCDAASAGLLYWDATQDHRVTGMVMLNPWVRTEAGLAKAHLKHHYGQRLLQADFWRKLLTGNLALGRSLKGFITSIQAARQTSHSSGDDQPLPFQKKMARGLERFRGSALVILSGNDFTAREFAEALKTDRAWQASLQRGHTTFVAIDDADHTFSSTAWRNCVATAVTDWLQREDSSRRCEKPQERVLTRSLTSCLGCWSRNRSVSGARNRSVSGAKAGLEP